MITSILACIGSLAVLCAVLRDGRPSLGLPIAYLYALLLIHVPGAFAHALPWADLPGRNYTETGIALTAAGAVAFVVGAWLARRRKIALPKAADPDRPGRTFWVFCLVLGWAAGYVLLPALPIASVSAVVQALFGVWTLGVLLGLRKAIEARRVASVVMWSLTLLVTPVLTLINSGFLSYGSTSIIITLSGLMILFRQPWTLGASLVVGTYLGMSLFVGYFAIRDDIRYVTWSAAGTAERVAAISQLGEAAAWFDIRDPEHADYLDQRLNQNYFVGLAANRLQDGDVDWFAGRSLAEGVIAFVPRIFWPEKPVANGSGTLVADLTGLNLSLDSSFGVGNVLEFYANFGWVSLIAGFLALGWVLGWLDVSAAVAERAGNYRTLLVCYLVAVALIIPNGSIVELATGSASAWIAALACGWLWSEIQRRANRRSALSARSYPPLYAEPRT